MIEGWNSKHLWKHMCMQAAREAVHWACGRFKKSWACGLSRTQRCDLQGVCTFLLPLGSRRRSPTGPGYQRTNVDGSLQTGKIWNLQNPVWMWPYGVLSVKRCFGNGICTNTFKVSQSHANFMMTPTILSSISMYPHERDYVKSLFENPGKALTWKCPKNDKNPHDCDCAL